MDMPAPDSQETLEAASRLVQADTCYGQAKRVHDSPGVPDHAAQELIEASRALDAAYGEFKATLGVVDMDDTIALRLAQALARSMPAAQA